jgi:para-nitrobenzyl esterase
MKNLLPITASLAILLLVNSCNCKTSFNNGNRADLLDSSTSAALVQTHSGKVAGYKDGSVLIFKGIPYARAGRFEEPRDTSWEGVRSSRAYGPTAPQAKRMGWYSDEQAFAFDWDDGFADEDCLRLNIWTSGLNDHKRPVMVWLHGGGFHGGSGQEQPGYDGTNMARAKDVVMVTLNHRLNVLGYLDLSAFGEKYANTGNLGMLDIVKALEWINENIAKFGGDPNNVTIFGQSGGGGKVSTLMAMPCARGLFCKAIIQSGSITTVMQQKYSRRVGVATVRELGIKASEIDKIKDVPYETLLKACHVATQKVRKEAIAENLLVDLMFGTEPTVDGKLLPAQPGEEKSISLSKDIPVIIGTTHDEFTPHQEDTVFGPLAVAQARSRVAAGAASVYMYRFDWTSPVLDGALGSMHCMEIPFVFDNVERHKTMTGGREEDVQLGHRISAAWAAFARTGVPSAEGLPEWKPFTRENEETMIFNTDTFLKTKQ